MKSIVCPSCGAKLAFVFQQSYLKCEYCGNVIKDETVDDTVRLENEVQNILTAKPYMWEYKLFYTAISLGLQKASVQKNKFLSPLHFVDKNPQNTKYYLELLTAKVELLPIYYDSLYQIFQVDLPDALGLPGVPCDVQKLLDTAKSITSFYEQVLHWGIEFHIMAIPINLKDIFMLTKDIAVPLLEDVEESCYRALNILYNYQPGTKNQTDLPFIIRSPDVTPFMEEIEKFI